MNMSFSITTPQMYARIKTHTIRLGWDKLKPGMIVCAIEKGQGLKKGEHVVRIGDIKILSTTWKPLNSITQEIVVREGFPDWTPAQFIEMFVTHNHCEPDTLVNFISFEPLYL
jgi:hypothetical protein